MAPDSCPAGTSGLCRCDELRGCRPGLERAWSMGLASSWGRGAAGPRQRDHKMMETELGTHGPSRGLPAPPEAGGDRKELLDLRLLASRENEFPLFGAAWFVGLGWGSQGPSHTRKQAAGRRWSGPRQASLCWRDGSPSCPRLPWAPGRAGQHLRGQGTWGSDEQVANCLGCPPGFPGTWGSEC